MKLFSFELAFQHPTICTLRHKSLSDATRYEESIIGFVKVILLIVQQVTPCRLRHLLNVPMDETSFWSGLFLWFIVPPAATSFLLKSYYSIRKKSQVPTQGSLLYKRHYRVANIVVLVLYFIYSMANYLYTQQPTFYDIIRVQRFDIDEKLKSHFRQSVMNLHPDKTQSSDSSQFIELKQIYETLKNDDSRAAYDCYGPETFNAVNMSSSQSNFRGTLGEFFMQAINDWMIFYGGLIVVTFIHLIVGRRSGFIWKFLGIMSVATFELYAIMRPQRFGKPTPFFSHNIFLFGPLFRFWNSIPFFRKLDFCRKLLTYMSLCFGQIYEMFVEDNAENVVALLSKNMQLLKSLVVKEVDMGFSHSFRHFIEDQEFRNLLLRKMGRVAVDLELFDKMSSQERLHMSSRTEKKND